MDSIFVENLIFSGTHGVKKNEKTVRQRFGIDLKIAMLEPLYGDNIKNTFDYVYARDVVRSVIEGPHVNLIETLGELITAKILALSSRLMSVEVTIRKLDIWGNGIPGITLVRYQKNTNELIDFNIDMIMDALEKNGAISIPIIPEQYRKKLIKEAHLYEYKKEPRVLAGGRVYEELSRVTSFPEESLFFKLKEDFEELLWRKVSTLSVNPFMTPLHFNEMSIQRYNEGSIGITPHRDGYSFINIVAVFILEGSGKFALCDNRRGDNPYYLDTSPGNVIVLRAPGFCGSTKQPMHMIKDITRKRYVFGLRQKRCNT